MPRRRNSWPLCTVVVSLLLSSVSCDDGEDAPAGGGGGGGGTGLELAAADRGNVTPCPDQMVLTDAGLFADFVDGLQNGTFLYLDVPFDAGDAAIFRKKCGLGSAWDPADNTNEVAPAVTPVTITTLFTTGNAGICAEGFDNDSFGTGEGFPVAGTYRKEFKVNSGGTTWHVRVRIKIEGSAAGNTFADEGIAFPGGIATLVYLVNGVETPHDDVLTAALDGLEASDGMDAPSVTIEVRKDAAGPTILTVTAEIICVAIL